VSCLQENSSLNAKLLLVVAVSPSNRQIYSEFLQAFLMPHDLKVQNAEIEEFH
jgi:hypothetical protein